MFKPLMGIFRADNYNRFDQPFGKSGEIHKAMMDMLAVEKKTEYTFDVIYAILSIGVIGLASFGILHAAQGLSLFLIFIGLPVSVSL